MRPSCRRRSPSSAAPERNGYGGCLGYTPYQQWEHGRSWQLGAVGGYVVVEQSPALAGLEHLRTRPGMNHVAFWAGSPTDIEVLVGAAGDYGWSLLFADAHPYAGGPQHYAAYLEDQDGFEVELVAVMPTSNCL